MHFHGTLSPLYYLSMKTNHSLDSMQTERKGKSRGKSSEIPKSTPNERTIEGLQRRPTHGKSSLSYSSADALLGTLAFLSLTQSRAHSPASAHRPADTWTKKHQATRSWLVVLKSSHTLRATTQIDLPRPHWDSSECRIESCSNVSHARLCARRSYSRPLQGCTWIRRRSPSRNIDSQTLPFTEQVSLPLFYQWKFSKDKNTPGQASSEIEREIERRAHHRYQSASMGGRRRKSLEKSPVGMYHPNKFYGKSILP